MALSIFHNMAKKKDRGSEDPDFEYLWSMDPAESIKKTAAGGPKTTVLFEAEVKCLGCELDFQTWTHHFHDILLQPELRRFSYSAL